MKDFTLILTIICYVVTSHPVSCRKQPHIVLILADDYGFHDIGYHNSDIHTPTLDKLAAGGVKLENYYVQPICTPSRSQLLSGRYQIHTGLQHGIIWPAQPNGLPLEDKTVADQLKAAGYATHAVGKWHIGFYKKEYTPTYRGFDSYYGYLTGSEDYYTHMRCESKGNCGMDLHDNEEVVWNNTEYSTYLFSRKAEDVIKKHDQNKPLFLYLPFQAVHAPMQVPQKYIDPYPKSDYPFRRIYAGMVSCMDEAIRNITVTLKSAGLWEDTIIIFSTDNGGQSMAGGSNWPLRGNKGTLWEGGLHGVGFVHSPLLNKHVQGSTSKELMHITDWYPTLLHIAGSNASTQHLDGFNQWDTINNAALSPRKEILHNIDPLTVSKNGSRLFPDRFDTRTRAAIRVGDWKLITGDPGKGNWYPLPNSTTYGEQPDTSAKDQNMWLFNIKQDPNEHNDLSKSRPDTVKILLERLSAYNATAVPCRYPNSDPNSYPRHNGGAYVPWM